MSGVAATVALRRHTARVTVAFAVALAAAAGAAPLLGRSPAAVAVAPVALASAVLLIERPELALQLTFLLLLLPPGLLPMPAQFALSAAALLMTGAASLVRVRRTRTTLRVGPSIALLGAFVLWGVVTLLWTPSPAVAFDLLRRYAVLVLLLLVVVNIVKTRRTVDSLLNVLALAGWIVIGAAAWTLITSGYQVGNQLGVLGLNENEVGNVLLLMSVGVLWRAIHPRAPHRLRALLALYAYLALSLVVIALTGSRGSLLGFALLPAAFGFVRSLRQVAVVTALIAVATVAVAPAVFATVLERFNTPSQEVSRQTLWSSGLALLADHPWGVGLDNGPVVMRQYVNAEVSTDYFKSRDSYPAHNPLIEVADDTGLLGVALYGGGLVVAAAAFVAAAQRERRRRDPYVQRLVAVVGAVSIPFLLVWGKSGGAAYHITALVLLSLWVLPGVLQRADTAAERSG